MTPTRRAARAAATAAAAAAAALGATVVPAFAASGSPAPKGGVHCRQELRPSYRLADVVRHGMPIRITCDGPARFFAVPEFVAMTPQSRDLTIAGGHHHLYVSKVHERGLAAAGTVTVRPRLTRVAIRIMRKYRTTKMKVGMGTQREDGAFWSDPADWSRTVVRR